MEHGTSFGRARVGADQVVHAAALLESGVGPNALHHQDLRLKAVEDLHLDDEIAFALVGPIPYI